MKKLDAPIRVLQVLNHMDYGGIEAVVMNYYQNIDRNKVQFDFAVSMDSKLPQRNEIQELGGKIYLLPTLSHIFTYEKELSEIVRRYEYDIVHCHMNTLSVFALRAAKKGDATVRICHNHTTAYKGEGIRTWIKYLLRPFNKYYATKYYACSEYAGRWMYGNRCYDAGNVHIMRNGIDMKKFKPDMKMREKLRKELDLENKFVVGHVGRFMYQKNHDFLIEVFSHIYKENKQSRLLLIGEGELESAIYNKVCKLGLKKAVLFWGAAEHVENLYQVMDVFCFPSWYEGLGVVAIEAQACGLPVVASDVVPRDIVISDKVTFLNLNAHVRDWVHAVCNNNTSRYDITMLSKELELHYEVEYETIYD